ncbi:MAG: hypothetical protein J6W75_05680 [Bacteroidaceae bacterium]|nr:hypothetical protein [Bacteroidaceae bacterium]
MHTTHSLHLLHHLIYGCCLLFLTCCTGQRKRMEQIIQDAKEQNLNYVPFTTDSLLLEAVAYYDRHGTSNERLLAHYLFGYAYRDMNEAPPRHHHMGRCRCLCRYTQPRM